MQKRPGSSGFLSTGAGIALGAGLGSITALFTDLSIALAIPMGAAAGLLATLVSRSRR